MRAFLIAFSLMYVSGLAEQIPRYLNFEPGKTIASRLAPEDREVVIEQNLPPLLLGIRGELPVKEILEGYTLYADAVLIVRLAAGQAMLTDTRDCMVTRFKGQVLEQFKPQPLTLKVEDFVRELSGGTLTVGKARVEASAYWEPAFEVNHSYLVFPQSRKWPARDVVASEITADGRLKNMSRDFDPDDTVDNLHGLPLSDAKKIILAAPPRGRPLG